MLILNAFHTMLGTGTNHSHNNHHFLLSLNFKSKLLFVHMRCLEMELNKTHQLAKTPFNANYEFHSMKNILFLRSYLALFNLERT